MNNIAPLGSTAWGTGLTPNEPAWVGELIDAALRAREARIEELEEHLRISRGFTLALVRKLSTSTRRI